MSIDVFVTIPPYASFLNEAVDHPLVSGLRLNTVMPLKDGPREALQRLSAAGKPLWVDLKGRQLRVVGAAIPPFTEIRVSHPLFVETPAEVFFSDGSERGRIVAVDGDRLILEDGPRRLIGPGESVNIPHPSLRIDGTLTGNDRIYLEAMAEIGLNRVMLSYVEKPEDPAEVGSLLPNAEVLLKIETRRGLAFARKFRNTLGNLVAARGDLFVEVPRPHLMPGVLEEIVRADPRAVVASRIFDSMAVHPVPSSAEINDVAYLFRLGYRRFMLGDAVCLLRDSLIETLNLLAAMVQRYAGE